MLTGCIVTSIHLLLVLGLVRRSHAVGIVRVLTLKRWGSREARFPPGLALVLGRGLG